MAKLEKEKLPQLVEQLFSARTNISVIFIHSALKRESDTVSIVLADRDLLSDDSEAFIDFDYRLYHSLALASGNPIYALIFNGFKSLYRRVGRYYFTDSRSRELAIKFYNELANISESGQFEKARSVVKQYGVDSARIWSDMRKTLSEAEVFES